MKTALAFILFSGGILLGMSDGPWEWFALTHLVGALMLAGAGWIAIEGRG